MNIEEAKSILRNYRPGLRDAVSAHVADALEQVKRDPELARWFAEQAAFDAAMVSAVNSIEVPSTLKDSILVSRKLVERHPSPNWPLRWAAAATIILLASLALFWVTRNAATLTAFRQEVTESAWTASDHVGFASTELNQVQRWLKLKEAPADFTLPAAVQGLRMKGCRVVDWRGQKVSLVCFLDNGRHLHLFVVDEKALADLPPDNMPDFETYSGWRTVCWTAGNKTYLLTGVNYFTFIKKSRKGGQWLLTG